MVVIIKKHISFLNWKIFSVENDKFSILFLVWFHLQFIFNLDVCTVCFFFMMTFISTTCFILRMNACNVFYL